MDLCEFEASLVYRASSRTAKATQRNPVSKTNKIANSNLGRKGFIWLTVYNQEEPGRNLR